MAKARRAAAAPAGVRIIGKTWAVVFVPSGDMPEEYGTCDKVKQVIKVDEGAHPEQQRDTLLHEVLHALDHELDTKVSERQTRLMATGLLCVMQDNPALLSYLLNGSGDGK